jgi:hypothetical protein
MGVKLCCSDSRDKNPEPEMRRFDTFGGGDIAPVPNVMERVEDREVKVNLKDCGFNNKDTTDNIFKRKKENKSNQVN